MKIRPRHAAAWLAPVALAAAVTLTTAPSAHAAAPPVTTATTISAAARAAALAYWTPQRMVATGAENDATPEVIAKDWTAAPPPGVGRLFFVAHEGAHGPSYDDWCTATAVRGTSKDVAITAAHCLYPGMTDRDEIITVSNVVFAPAYAKGATPKGVFAARAYVLPTEYTKHSSPDVATVVFDKVGSTHLADAAGAQAVSFTGKAPGRTATFGYPGSSAVHGQSLRWCDLTASEQEGGSDRWRILCDLAGGASGGPWLTGFNPATGVGTIVSVTSKGTQDVDANDQVITTDLVGPKLGTLARAVYDDAERR